MDSRHALPLPDLHWWPWNSVTQCGQHEVPLIQIPMVSLLRTERRVLVLLLSFLTWALGVFIIGNISGPLWQVKEIWRFSQILATSQRPLAGVTHVTSAGVLLVKVGHRACLSSWWHGNIILPRTRRTRTGNVRGFLQSPLHVPCHPHQFTNR